MSVQAIIKKLDKLTGIHQQLVQLSKEKTTVIKEGAVEKLQAVLVKERKYVQQLEQAEESRRTEVEAWFEENKLPLAEATVTTMLQQLTAEEEKEAVEAAAVRLTEAIVELKQQEQLNMALIQQSMQFVQLSIDLLSPTLKSMNYGNKTQSEQSSVGRSVFDSKA
ncbi:flagellar protein FlgN [Ornithinibacillus contaminans]|uniref:flagellar protein FlgN n=1 Tax=Ornithinibacillus contaminans TaxID=694055 RepID=UPI00064E153C|nr:flagellar protein FlgN [Ornithinibacillus contaminans]